MLHVKTVRKASTWRRVLWMNAAIGRLRRLGYTPSEGGCWHDRYGAYVASVEGCGPATYGHPQAEMQLQIIGGQDA